jgi:hypothetical protein
MTPHQQNVRKSNSPAAVFNVKCRCIDWARNVRLTQNRHQDARSGKDGAAMPQKAIFWIFLISLLLAFPVTVSAQTGDGMIIIAGIVNGLHQFADLSLDFSVAPTTNTPGNEKVRPLGVKFGVTVRR